LFINFIKAALKGESLHIYGDGHQTRDFLYVKDLVEAIILASTKPYVEGQVFQIASGRETSVLDLLALMNAISFIETAKEVEYTLEPPRPGEAKRSYADNHLARLIMGWQPKYDLRTGMAETFKWYRRNYGHE
jgi:UDP-glucose 4-epimerase